MSVVVLLTGGVDLSAGLGQGAGLRPDHEGPAERGDREQAEGADDLAGGGAAEVHQDSPSVAADAWSAASSDAVASGVPVVGASGTGP